MPLIRSALTAGIRPSSPLVRAPDPYGAWTKYDYLLLEALQVIKDETCECGYPVWICRNESEDVQFRINKITCEANRLAETEGKKYDDKNKKPAGLSLRPEPFTVSGAPLSDFRHLYYEQQKVRREAMSA